MKSKSKVELSLSTISGLTEHHLGTPTRAVEELDDGWFNTIYRATLSDGRDVVLKMAPPPGFQVMRYERNILASEVAVLDLLGKTDGVPVPAVLAYDDSRSLHPHDFFLMEYIPGTPYNKLHESLAAEEREPYDFQLGRICARIHSITGERFGRYQDDHCATTSWQESFSAMIEDLLLDADDTGVELPVPAESIREACRTAQDELAEVTKPHLVAWDLHPGNVFVDNGSIRAIIDCDRALWGDPLMEYPFRTIDWKRVGFHRGYASDALLSQPGAERRIWLYDLYHALVVVVECGFRGYEGSHIEWARNELARVMSIARPGWLSR
jgi:aminoglycoside phosphotransferase (APT) family kinase protein